MALVETVRTRYKVDISMFEPENRAATLARHNRKPTIHLAIPALQQHNLKQPFFAGTEDVLRSIFKDLLEEQALYTAFSSFSQPKASQLPLSVRAISRDCTQYVDGDELMWASVSGYQYSPHSPHPELIKLWIRRAGKQPLSFHIAPQRHTDDDEWEDERTPEILHIFLRHAERWKNIAFELDDKLAPIYANHFADKHKPKPQQLEHLELSASSLTDVTIASSLFSSVKACAGTITKFLWGCPIGFGPSETIILPQVTVLGLDVHSLGDAFSCLKKLRMPRLEELKICFTGDRGFDFWSDLDPTGVTALLRSHALSEALRHLARMPTKLYIEDDEIDAEDVKTLIRLANANGIMTLALLVPEPEIVTKQCEELIAENPTFWDKVWQGASGQGLPYIKGYRVMDDDGSVEIDLFR